MYSLSFFFLPLHVSFYRILFRSAFFTGAPSAPHLLTTAPFGRGVARQHYRSNFEVLAWRDRRLPPLFMRARAVFLSTDVETMVLLPPSVSGSRPDQLPASAWSMLN